ncbi:MAG: oxygen-independent coproporphyrinogen III oxidase [Cyclobacteriaceae bacterium]|nr:oxygen-independent coproporphyrinogen III oxidase [Cyclobacteriaceae bacterium]
MNAAKDQKIEKLIQKYNIPVPRYTSYPTVPMWEYSKDLDEAWLGLVQKVYRETNAQKGISLYIHLPFCEHLCTYCGCTQHITRNHTVEPAYIEALLKEWKQYTHRFETPHKIREMHLGGGTPTFFSPENLQYLLGKIFEGGIPYENPDFSFEGHPNTTTRAHLDTLYSMGFRRVSFGVQDFDEKVQVTINRIQPYENVVSATRHAREAGYQSINFDLVYGLPFQSLSVIDETINKVLELMPDRIAFYSYAHVPWKRPGQRKYTEADLPDNAYKRALYEKGREMLLQAGYREIGMDHFALPHDSLYKAWEAKKLHRNFMGYTIFETDLMIGLGMSAISDARYAFAQNVKKVKDYQDRLSSGQSTLINGHILSEEDIKIQGIIKEIICQGQVVFYDAAWQKTLPAGGFHKLIEMEQEGLVEVNEKSLKVTNPGKPFIRNICSVFDKRHWQSQATGPRYSKSI